LLGNVLVVNICRVFGADIALVEEFRYPEKGSGEAKTC